MTPILTTLSTLQCPHGGQVLLTTSNAVAQVDGGFFLLQTDIHSVVGCPFLVVAVAHPCVTVQWLTGATVTKVNQVPVLLQNSVGLCFAADQVPQGPPTILQVQTNALGQ